MRGLGPIVFIALMIGIRLLNAFVERQNARKPPPAPQPNDEWGDWDELKQRPRPPAESQSRPWGNDAPAPGPQTARRLQVPQAGAPQAIPTARPLAQPPPLVQPAAPAARPLATASAALRAATPTAPRLGATRPVTLSQGSPATTTLASAARAAAQMLSQGQQPAGAAQARHSRPAAYRPAARVPQRTIGAAPGHDPDRIERSTTAFPGQASAGLRDPYSRMARPERGKVRIEIRDRASLRQAVLLHEILGRPRAFDL